MELPNQESASLVTEGTTQPKVVLIAGMHRSGTSMLARLLNLHGSYLPLEMEYKDRFNQRGYWESFKIQKLNDELLRLGDSTWFDLREFSLEKQPAERVEELYEEYSKELRQIAGQANSVITIKDPRVCRVIPFWKRILREQGFQTSAIIPFRNPLEVAESIRNRDGFKVRYILLLWLRYILEAEAATRDMDRVFCSYQRMLSDWPGVFAQITSTLGLSDLKPYENVEDRINDFISGSLRHWEYSESDIEKYVGADGLTLRVYQLLRALDRGEGEGCREEFDELHVRFNQSDLVLDELQQFQPKFDKTQKSLELELDGSREELAKAQQQLTDAHRILGLQEGRLLELDNKLLLSLNSNVQMQKQVADLNNTVSELKDQLSSTETELAGKLRTLSEIEERNSSLTDRLEALREESSQQISDLINEVKQRSLKVGALEEELEQGSLKVGALEEELEQGSLKVGALEEELEQRALKVGALEEELEQGSLKVGALEEELEQGSLKVGALEEELEQGSLKVGALEEELEQGSLKVGALEEELEQRSLEVGELKDMVSVQSEENQRLWRDVADRDSTIENIGNSLSWKVTAPLRFAFDCLVLYPVSLLRKAKTGIGAFVRRRGSDAPPANAVTLIDEETSERRYVEKSEATGEPEATVRLLAFYLPQFHPIPENDEWWGKGFTEWTNVTRAKPLFRQHHQPRVPVDLGYYDLRNTEIQKKQVELAKLYGLGGFCFYFYWFHGVRLLETPLLQYLENPDLDLPFCLCWANENWTRTWDGLEGQVLIGQEHSEEDDLGFIEYLSRYIHDPRYIRVDGKPLLLVYRPGLLPNPAQTADRWRQWCRENGLGEIYLAYPQSFERVDPAVFGFDAAIEFPPNNTGPDILTHQVKDLPAGFKGYVYDWTSIARRSETYAKPDYTLLRCVNPSWDNTARRPDTGAVFVGTTPDRYQRWLENAIEDTKACFEEPSERLIFINAWNEWAEGAYLEPDSEYGYAYLQATRNALENASSDSIKAKVADRKIILVAHDGHPHGAQYLMLYTARCLKQYFRFDVDLVVLGDGILVEEFEKWATVHSLAGVDHRGRKAKELADSLAAAGHTAAICNTTVSGLFLETLSKAGLKCISLVHELCNVIRDNHLEEHARSIAKNADKVVFAAKQVRDPFLEVSGVPKEKTLIRFQGNYKKNAWLGRKKSARKQLRKALGLPKSAQIVLGAGYLDHRKGVDLFVEAGLEVCRDHPDAYFVWIGHWEMDMEKQIMSLLDGHELEDRFIFPGRQDDTDLFFAGADVFALTSREDPFPTTVMEALEVATPVIGFAGSGGSESLINKGCGTIVPMEDTGALASAFIELLDDPERAEGLGKTGAQIVHDEFSFPHYVFDLLELAGKPLPRVSAIVPNYNYERHLEQRLRSIFEQNFPVYELIVLDDASSDSSVELITDLLSETEIHNRLEVNESNSGSVFWQWAKGVEMAKGDLVWICEADDSCAPQFLDTCLSKFTDEVVISYTQSSQIDERGQITEENYLRYTDDVSDTKWNSDYVMQGEEELKSTLSVKNTLPNVSAVVFRKRSLEQALIQNMDVLKNLKVAGDWLIYSEILKTGKIAFTAESLNFHRRHSESVTISFDNNLRHMSEILYMHDRIAKMIPIGEESKSKAKDFAGFAYKYLDLETAEYPTPCHNPSVQAILSGIED